MLLETLTINLCAAISKSVLKMWLKDQPIVEAAGGSAIDMIKEHVKDWRSQRETAKLLTGMEDEVARTLEPFIRNEFPGLSETEQELAVTTTSAIIGEVDFARIAIAGNLDAATMEANEADRIAKHTTSLAPKVAELTEVLFREACNYVVSISGNLPNFTIAVNRLLLQRTDELLADVKSVIGALDAARERSKQADDQPGAAFETQYRRMLARRLDRLHLFGVRLTGSGTREYPLSVAYVTLSTTKQQTKETGTVDEALKGVRRAVISGEAGSGKTTLLDWLVVRAANGDFPPTLAGWAGRVPFYLRLREYVGRPFPKPAEFVEAHSRALSGQMPPEWTFRTLLNRGLLLIDGVDEVAASSRQELAPWIEDLCEAFPECIVLVTSRPAALESGSSEQLRSVLDRQHFQLITLEAMSLEDSEALITQWHRAVARDLGDAEARAQIEAYDVALRQVIRERAPIRALASNPLLCAMICALNWDQRQILPEQRMVLYSLALDLLLERRDTERRIGASGTTSIARHVREQALDALAYSMLLNDWIEIDDQLAIGNLNDFLQRFPQLSLTGEALLEELLERSGILRRPQHGTVDFIHRTFLEYMGARHAVVKQNYGHLASQLPNDSWREPIVFAVGHAQGAARDTLLRTLLKTRASTIFARSIDEDLTIACCLETARDNVAPALYAELVGRARRLFPPKDLASAQRLAIAATGNLDLLRGYADGGESIVAACIRAAATLGTEDALAVVQEYAGVPGDAIEKELMRSWMAFDEEVYFERVVRQRDTFFGIRLSGLSPDQTLFFRLAMAKGLYRTSNVAGTLRSRLELIESSQYVLVNWWFSAMTADEDSVAGDARTLGARRIQLAYEQLQGRAQSGLSLADLRVLSRFGRVRKLETGDMAPGAEALLGQVKGLESLDLATSNAIDFQRLFAAIPDLSELSILAHAPVSMLGLESARALRVLRLFGKCHDFRDRLPLQTLHDLTIVRFDADMAPDYKAGERLASFDFGGAALKSLNVGVDVAVCELSLPPSITRLTASGAGLLRIRNYQVADDLESLSLEVDAVEELDRILALPKLHYIALSGRGLGLRDQLGTFAARGGHVQLF